MKRFTHLLSLAVLLALLLTACRVVSPPRTPSPSSTSSSLELGESIPIRLSEGFMQIVWRWDTPAGKMPVKSERPVDEVAEFRRRFAKFCTDVGIVKPGETALPMEGDVPRVQHVRLQLGSRAWERIRELNRALSEAFIPRQIVMDLLVLEVPGKLTRQWGLDGLPPGGKTPLLLADGVPSVLEPEDYSTLRSLILEQPGARVFATASVTTLSGKTGIARRVEELSYCEEVSVDATDPIPDGVPKEGEEQKYRSIPSLAWIIHARQETAAE